MARIPIVADRVASKNKPAVRLTPNQADNQAAKNAATRAMAPKGADAMSNWLAPKPAAKPAATQQTSTNRVFTPAATTAPVATAAAVEPVQPVAAAPAAPNLDPNTALNDPVYQYYMNEALGGFRGESVRERERLSNLFTDIYGQTGQLRNFDTQATQDQRRLAAEMASRGTLRSGAYAGGERGLGTQQQKQQGSQRAQIERGYTDQTSPQALFDMGLTRGPDNRVRELVQGETTSWRDPATGETKSMQYDWTQTTAGRAAKQAALQQWMQKQLAGVTSVI
jgi:hypothetical protein